ncbi:UNVERIFIED_CONTAM: hypothetical protein HDU68_010903 [Siphonaria sp. JEL0065]|nr:hypothetical protein HDU68_010903 [Siphonaria sp. JEL0065]
MPPPLKPLKRAFNDSDDEDPWSQARPTRPPPSALLNDAPVSSSANDDDDDEEEDPLDAFMKSNTAATKEAVAPKQNDRLDLDDQEDYVESYAKAMKAKGIDIGSSTTQERGDDYNSDEEVYATARALDNKQQQQLDSADNPDGSRKEIEPLARVDHSKVEYIEIEKNLLREHPDITALSEADVHRIRRELDMRVSGHDIAKPCISFAHFMFEDCLVSTIAKAGFSKPTAIQQQAVPVVLNGRDLIAVSKTGSGKTVRVVLLLIDNVLSLSKAAFVWPMIVRMMDQPELEWGDGPIGLILAPTRELASQIYTETKKFGKAYSLKSAVVYGGASKTDQFKELRNGGIEILVATPGRLIDLVKMKALNLRRVSFLVLDEADRMFDLGVDELAENLNKSGYPCTPFHGDLMQHERDKVIQDCKANRIKILVATDVAARGLDIKTVRTVINFDVARDIDSHVHRCGRTGRAGEKGKAFTLITQKEDRFAADLVQNFEESMVEVPPDLLALAMKNPRFRGRRSGGGGGGRGGGFGARGRGRGRGGIGFGSGGRDGSSNPNLVPIGGGGDRGGFSSSGSRGGFGNRGGFGFNQPREESGQNSGRGSSIQFRRGGSDWKSTSFR